uniref:Uncharacterized protein n=1 Tax=Haptolina ericina TaxID=156174 RepID=A0A7S3ATI7_9EUKA
MAGAEVERMRVLTELVMATAAAEEQQLATSMGKADSPVTAQTGDPPATVGVLRLELAVAKAAVEAERGALSKHVGAEVEVTLASCLASQFISMGLQRHVAALELKAALQYEQRKWMPKLSAATVEKQMLQAEKQTLQEQLWAMKAKVSGLEVMAEQSADELVVAVLAAKEQQATFEAAAAAAAEQQHVALEMERERAVHALADTMTTCILSQCVAAVEQEHLTLEVERWKAAAEAISAQISSEQQLIALETERQWAARELEAAKEAEVQRVASELTAASEGQLSIEKAGRQRAERELAVATEHKLAALEMERQVAKVNLEQAAELQRVAVEAERHWADTELAKAAEKLKAAVEEERQRAEKELVAAAENQRAAVEAERQRSAREMAAEKLTAEQQLAAALGTLEKMHSAELDRWQTEHVARARAEAHVATLTEQQEEMRLLQEELTKQARQLKEQLEAAAQEKEDALVLQRMDLLKEGRHARKELEAEINKLKASARQK